MDPSLHQFVQTGSQEAFRRLVEQNIDAVYSQARRMIGDPSLAEDITQVVFLMLSRNAKRIRPDAVLAGWLHRATHYACLNARRTRARRERHERLAARHRSETASAESQWIQIEPVLDEAIARLSSSDRDAIMLRFWNGQSSRQIAEALKISEDAARKRVNRAIERLRSIFSKRGVPVPVLSLSAILEREVVRAAPANLTTALLTAPQMTAAAKSSVAEQAARWMLLTKARLVAAGAAAALSVGVAGVAMNQLAAANPPQAATLPTTAPATTIPAAGYGTPAAAIAAFVRSIDESKLPPAEELLVAEDPAERDMHFSLLSAEAAATRLTRVAEERFGILQSDIQLVTFPYLKGGLAALIRRAMASPQTYELIETGDAAELKIKLQPNDDDGPGRRQYGEWASGSIFLKKIGGRWKFDLGKSINLEIRPIVDPPKNLDYASKRAMLMRFNEVFTPQLKLTADAIEDGLVPSPGAAAGLMRQCYESFLRKEGLDNFATNLQPRK